MGQQAGAGKGEEGAGEEQGFGEAPSRRLHSQPESTKGSKSSCTCCSSFPSWQRAKRGEGGEAGARRLVQDLCQDEQADWPSASTLSKLLTILFPHFPR